jgi:phosphonate transport system substrate-binding protein
MRAAPRRSRLTAWSASLLIAAALLAGRARAEEAVYSVGVVPQFEARRLSEIWLPILEELGRRTGARFVLKGSENIPDFEAEFQSGKFDFAYMNPYHSLLANETQGYELLVRDGDRWLSGVLVVPVDSPYQDVSALDGQAISFPGPNALGASLLMRAELSGRFGLDYQTVYSQTHTSAYLNVVMGVTAAAGGVRSTLEGQPPEIRERLRVLHTTQQVAPHPVVAHPRVPEEVRRQVQRALIELGESEEGRALLAEIPIRRPVEARLEDYLPLKEAALGDFDVSRQSVGEP